MGRYGRQQCTWHGRGNLQKTQDQYLHAVRHKEDSFVSLCADFRFVLN